jgi:hypothetical protein
MKPYSGLEPNIVQIFVPHWYYGDTNEVDSKLGGGLVLKLTSIFGKVILHVSASQILKPQKTSF